MKACVAPFSPPSGPGRCDEKMMSCGMKTRPSSAYWKKERAREREEASLGIARGYGAREAEINAGVKVLARKQGIKLC